MKLHLYLAVIVGVAAWFRAPGVCGESAVSLDKLRVYEQAKPLSDPIETRQAVFLGTADEAVRARRERELLTFIASDAHLQAKAIAVEWLGILGSAASVPGLVAAREIPDLAAPATAALTRIEPAKATQPAKRPAISPAVAEVAEFHDSLGKGNDDVLLTAALRSPNDLLGGTAVRLLRTGAGSAGLMTQLVDALDQIPPARQVAVGDALATRPDAVSTLRPVLVARVRSGDPAALLTLGRILLPEDLPWVLESSGALAPTTKSALARATNPEINSALLRHAMAGSALSVPAIDALAARHAVDAEATLWDLTSSSDAAISAASYKALGAVIPPAQLPAVLDRLAAAQGKPAAAEMGTLLWNIARRHPDPSSAANLLEQRAANAPGEMKQVLLRYATRLRPKENADSGPALQLPVKDDRLQLIPNTHQEVAYHDCGTLAETRAGNTTIRRSNGQNHQFGHTPHPLASMDFGSGIAYEITGLDPAADYVLGVSSWDADQKGRRQSLAVNGTDLLTDFAPVAYHADQPTYMRVHLPLPRALTSSGKATVTIKSLAGPNAVLSELWLLRREPDAPAARRVVVLTGDDYPSHDWRVTGPEFAAVLRTDPRLEVTLSESPALLGSPTLSAYDAVFLHFKNYQNRLPTSEALWKNLESYIRNGGGLVIAHFGCGALQEWNGFVTITGRVWDPKRRGHDPYGDFLVRMVDIPHPATAGIQDFTTTDELYTCLAGETEIQVLAEATSKADQKNHPMAFILTPGKGRVFHCPLGHDLRSLQTNGTRKLYRQVTFWVAGGTK